MALSRQMRSWFIKLAGSALALGLLFWLLSDDTILEAFRSVHLATFLFVLLGFILAHVAAGLKWWYILGCELSPVAAIRAHFSGLAANLGLPGAVGGDVVRAAVSQYHVGDGAKVVASAGADRLIDMVALLTISLVGMTFVFDSVSHITHLVIAGLLLLAVFVGLLLLPTLVNLVWGLAPNLPGRAFADKLVGAFGDLVKRPERLLVVLVASLAIQTALVLLALWLGNAAGADVGLGPWLFAWPLAKIVAILPVTLNGLGLREGVLAAFLAPFGAVPEAIVAAGLIWQAVMFVVGGLGAVVLLLSRRQNHRELPATENTP